MVQSKYKIIVLWGITDLTVLGLHIVNKIAKGRKPFYSDIIIAKAKVEGKTLKAPWSGGILFGNNYEGMSSFSLGRPQISYDTTSIPVYLAYKDLSSKLTAHKE